MKLRISILILGISILACGRSEPRRLELYPSPTFQPAQPTQTERIVVWTSTAAQTYTPIVNVITETPSPEYLCVSADEAVYLRPSPGIEYHPIAPLPNGERVLDLESKNGNWIFVSYKDKSGWVNQKYLEECK